MLVVTSKETKIELLKLELLLVEIMLLVLALGGWMLKEGGGC